MINKKQALVALILSLAYFSAFAATWDSSSNTTTSSDNTTIDTWSSDSTDPLANDSGSSDATDTSLNSATATGTTWALAVAKGGVWNYTEVACDKDYFTTNACNQCFDWWKKAVWEKITNLTDSWTNPNSGEQVIYKDEQVLPELVNLWGNATSWISNPQDSSKFWKFSDEIIWTDSKTWSWKQEFLLEWGKTVNFLEWDLWATYIMTSTDKKLWEPAGLLKFSIAYHDISDAGNEGSKLNHVECVSYLASAQAAKAPTPKAKEITKVKTWPDIYILFFLAFAIAFGFVKLRKKA